MGEGEGEGEGERELWRAVGREAGALFGGCCEELSVTVSPSGWS